MNYGKIRRGQVQAGRKYEYYIAWKLRKEGWDVEETGRDGIYDHGIDLVAVKDNKKRYVQCKGLKRWKRINENVVSQLFGDIAAIEGLDNIKNVELYIYSPAKMSGNAIAEAFTLNVHFERVSFPRWRRKRERI